MQSASSSPTWPTGPTTAPASTRGGPRSTVCAPSPTSIRRASSSWRARAPASRRSTDLKGKRVSLDEPGSGTLVDARLILAAYGLDREGPEGRIPQVAAGRRQAEGGDARRLLQRERLAARRRSPSWRSRTGIDLVPIDGPEVESAGEDSTASSRADEIPGRRLQERRRREDGERATRSGLTSIKQPEALIYAITAALWNPNTRKLLDSGHAKGKIIRLETALRRRSAFRCIRARRSSTRKRASSNKGRQGDRNALEGQDLRRHGGRAGDRCGHGAGPSRAKAPRSGRPTSMTAS